MTEVNVAPVDGGTLDNSIPGSGLTTALEPPLGTNSTTSTGDTSSPSSTAPGSEASVFTESSVVTGLGSTSILVSPTVVPSPLSSSPISSTMSSTISSTLSSSHTTAAFTLADSTATAASTAPPIVMENTSKVNGLIAGIVVLVVLFLAMTAAFIWAIRGKRGKTSTHKRAFTISAPRSPVISKNSLDPSLAGLESTIAILETQLHEKDTQLRERQVSMIAKGQVPNQTPMANRASMPDNHMVERYIALQEAVSTWVRTHFGSAKFTATPIPDAVAVLKKTFPQYANLLKEHVSVAVILEGLVLDMISQSVASGQLLGNEAFWELKQAISSTVSVSEAIEWRALTIRLLERTTNYHSDRKEAVEDLSQTIDAACSELTKTRPRSERRESLEQIVDSAASLTLDMAKQRTMFRIERPPVAVFDPEVMEALNGDKGAAPGAPIQAVVFPALTKSSGELAAGSAWDSSLVIVKAKVLL